MCLTNGNSLIKYYGASIIYYVPVTERGLGDTVVRKIELLKLGIFRLANDAYLSLKAAFCCVEVYPNVNSAYFLDEIFV